MATIGGMLGGGFGAGYANALFGGQSALANLFAQQESQYIATTTTDSTMRFTDSAVYDAIMDRAKPKTLKKLTLCEELQADVDEWLPDITP